MAEDSPSLEELLAELASDDTSVAEGAQFALQKIGAPAVVPVLQRLPCLGVFGQRCALELLQMLPSQVVQAASNPSVATAVIPLLSAEDDVVRAWAADTLRHADARVAIPALRRALDRVKQSGVPVDGYEPVALRRTLTALGDRREVRPALLARLAQRAGQHDSHWPAEHLRGIIDALAAEKQVLLYFSAWQRRDHSLYWVKSPSFAVDVRGSWPEVVERARLAAKNAADAWVTPPNTVVTLEWIGENDR